jgi:hypothetical protein
MVLESNGRIERAQGVGDNSGHSSLIVRDIGAAMP